MNTARRMTTTPSMRADSDPRAAEIMNIAYSSPKVMDRLVTEQSARTVGYFKKYDVPMDADAIRMRLYALNGAVGGFVNSHRSSSGTDYKSEL